MPNEHCPEDTPGCSKSHQADHRVVLASDRRPRNYVYNFFTDEDDASKDVTKVISSPQRDCSLALVLRMLLALHSRSVLLWGVRVLLTALMHGTGPDGQVRAPAEASTVGSRRRRP